MGRKGKSGMTGGGGSTNAGNMTAAQIRGAINRASFSDEGGGNWQLDIPGVGGGQILDETGSSRDPMYGRGGKVYSINTWDDGYNTIPNGSQLINGSLNDAKRALKDTLKGYLGAVD